MLSKVKSFGLMGIDGYVVIVETDISNGIPSFDMVGLGDTAVKESKERVRAAIKNAGLEFPIRRITVNLAPADKKRKDQLLTCQLQLEYWLLLSKSVIEISKVMLLWGSSH